VWNSLGSLPVADEIEVTVLGPGYGESVVVHLGNGHWLIVDSCVDSSDPEKPVAPLKYLRSLGVEVEQAVKYIVVSHWDDDHVKGISDVVEACIGADFICSEVFPNEQFVNFVEAICIGDAMTDGGNVKNIRKVMQLLGDRKKTIKRAGPSRTLRNDPKITSWSPSDLEQQEFLKFIAAAHPKAREALRKAMPSTSNLTSVVLTIEWDDVSVLLGADMETQANILRGWGAIAAEVSITGLKPADLVKIPHHGSKTGHDDLMWNKLLLSDPISVITPFGKAKYGSKPPTKDDVTRIRGKSRKVFITARHAEPKLPKMEVAVQRSLREGSITLTTKKLPIGIVRHRRRPGAGWHSEIFGAAYCSK
jgi:beta-lactamase superfamily II metal-dependent hydrolase